MEPKEFLGLYTGQMRGPNPNYQGPPTGNKNIVVIGHNAGWFNEAGEKLGWGDLSQLDIEKLMVSLEHGEKFFIVEEEAWRVGEGVQGPKDLQDKAHMVVMRERWVKLIRKGKMENVSKGVSKRGE